MREFRVVKEGDAFCPEWRSVWTFLRWKRFYFSKDNELEDFVFMRTFTTEDEAWDFIIEKKSEPKFNDYDIINNEGED
jgi:hypothetical protein